MQGNKSCVHSLAIAPWDECAYADRLCYRGHPCRRGPQVPQLIIFGIYINTMGLFQNESTQDLVLSFVTLSLSVLSLVYNLVGVCVGCHRWSDPDKRSGGAMDSAAIGGAPVPNDYAFTVANPMFTLPTDPAVATTLTTPDKPRTTKNGRPACACA